MHFGYIASLLCLFFAGFFLSHLYRRLLIWNCSLNPVLVVYALIVYSGFIFNPTIENWISTNLFADGLRILVIYLLIKGFSAIGMLFKKELSNL